MENTNLSDSLTGSFYLLKISQLAELMKITLKLNPKLNITNNNYNNPQTVPNSRNFKAFLGRP